MKNITLRKRLDLIGTALAIFIAFFGAYQMIGNIRTVDIIILFFGGFGAGAGMVKLILDYRKQKSDSDSTAH
jgi:hypothetical protein